MLLLNQFSTSCLKWHRSWIVQSFLSVFLFFLKLRFLYHLCLSFNWVSEIGNIGINVISDEIWELSLFFFEVFNTGCTNPSMAHDSISNSHWSVIFVDVRLNCFCLRKFYIQVEQWFFSLSILTCCLSAQNRWVVSCFCIYYHATPLLMILFKTFE